MAVAWSTVDSGSVTLSDVGTEYEVLAPQEVINRLGHVNVGAQGSDGVLVLVYGSLVDDAWNGGNEYTLLKKDTLESDGQLSITVPTWRYTTVRAMPYEAGDTVQVKMGWLPW